MFLSINLSKLSDRDMLRFVWAKIGSSNPESHRFCVIAFGLISAPYLAIWCLRETVKKFTHKYPEAVAVIMDLTYMDDLHNMQDEFWLSVEVTLQILEILEFGGFHGHKITASDPKILEGLDETRCADVTDVAVLGLKLDHKTDEFCFDLDDNFTQLGKNASSITHRDIVSLASQVFDTQGFVAPFVMQPNAFPTDLFQESSGQSQA